MKVFFLIFLYFFTANVLLAQPPTPGSNVVNNYINKFVGDWMWVSGADTILIKLRKYNTSFGNYTEDVLMGVHKYIQNGVILDNDLDKLDSISINKKKRSILFYSNAGSDTSKIEGSIKDLTKKKDNLIYLQFINTNPPTIIWKLELPEGGFSDPNFQYGLTMPKDLILTKQ